MTYTSIPTPSTQVDSTLPQFISETYKEFVKFMTVADESEERVWVFARFAAKLTEVS